MSTHENKAIVRRLLEEAWNQNRLADIDAYVAADRVHHSGTGVGPQGPEALRANPATTSWLFRAFGEPELAALLWGDERGLLTPAWPPLCAFVTLSRGATPCATLCPWQGSP